LSRASLEARFSGTIRSTVPWRTTSTGIPLAMASASVS
jgi:hypothetical protein